MISLLTTSFPPSIPSTTDSPKQRMSLRVISIPQQLCWQQDLPFADTLGPRTSPLQPVMIVGLWWLQKKLYALYPSLLWVPSARCTLGVGRALLQGGYNYGHFINQHSQYSLVMLSRNERKIYFLYLDWLFYFIWTDWWMALPVTKVRHGEPRSTGYMLSTKYVVLIPASQITALIQKWGNSVLGRNGNLWHWEYYNFWRRWMSGCYFA